MQCRHTVPDWHRYVDPEGDAAPIFAGCRLLVHGGEPARDPRSIACAYWGHQGDCPLFEGPRAAARTRPKAAGRRASTDVPVRVDAVWPVRAPGAMDGMRLVMIGLGVLSTALMLLTLGVGFSLLGEKTPPVGCLHLTLLAGVVSIATHVLATLRSWARR